MLCPFAVIQLCFFLPFRGRHEQRLIEPIEASVQVGLACVWMHRRRVDNVPVTIRKRVEIENLGHLARRRCICFVLPMTSRIRIKSAETKPT